MRRFFVSLGWKLTASFALFGLLLSWLGIMLYGTKTTAEIISSVDSTLRATTSQLFPDRSYDFISSLKQGDNDALLSVLRTSSDGVPAGTKALTSPALGTPPPRAPTASSSSSRRTRGRPPPSSAP
jgi:hypothetical protein